MNDYVVEGDPIPSQRRGARGVFVQETPHAAEHARIGGAQQNGECEIIERAIEAPVGFEAQHDVWLLRLGKGMRVRKGHKSA